MHLVQFEGNLLIVASRKNLVQLLHSLIVRINVLSLSTHFVIQFEGSGYYVLSLYHKIVEISLLIW